VCLNVHDGGVTFKGTHSMGDVRIFSKNLCASLLNDDLLNESNLAGSISLDSTFNFLFFNRPSMKKIKAFFDNGRSKREEERAESSDYAAAIAKLPKLETLAVNLNIIDSLPLTGSKVGLAAALLFTVERLD
jgi:hypothetical protein